MELLFLLLVPLVPIVSIWLVIRHDPIRNRWGRGEHPIGFALFVGGIAFLAGYIGPLFHPPEANQGTLVGLVWGMLRADRGRKPADDTA